MLFRSDESLKREKEAEATRLVARRENMAVAGGEMLTAAFGLQNTRSPQAVEGRAEYAKLQAKKRAGGKLTRQEREKAGQLRLFAEVPEET